MGRRRSVSNVLTRDQVEEVFTQCDEGSGFISIKRLKVILRALGLEPRHTEVEKITARMLENEVARCVSADSFSLEELIYVLEDKMKGGNEGELSQVFHLFDHERKGYINLRDLRRIADELGEHLKDDELNEMINEANSSHVGGYVTEADFKNIMKKTGLY